MNASVDRSIVKITSTPVSGRGVRIESESFMATTQRCHESASSALVDTDSSVSMGVGSP